MRRVEPARRILGIAELSSPYTEIAADVNGSRSVTTLDISLIRRLILGISTSYPDGVLWQFVPSDYGFANPSVPWPFISGRSFSNLGGDWTGQDFIGIKMGDANGSWMAP